MAIGNVSNQVRKVLDIWKFRRTMADGRRQTESRLKKYEKNLYTMVQVEKKQNKTIK